MQVHAAADIFPMLSDDELNELAADIAANGLINPIVVKDGVLIDGRNRLEACKRAGVQPTFAELNGADPATYILSANINRRHMTKGQRAMAVAMIYPDPKRGMHSELSNSTGDFDKGYLSRARTVLRWAQEMAPQVLAGAETLDKAYTVASDRKIAAEAPVKRLAALRARDPDLADKVVEEALSIDDAEGAAKARRDRERAARQGTYDALATLERYLFMFSDASHRAEFVDIVRNHPNEISRDDVMKSLTDWTDAINATIGAINEG